MFTSGNKKATPVRELPLKSVSFWVYHTGPSWHYFIAFNFNTFTDKNKQKL
jgi:hypothetical protein